MRILVITALKSIQDEQMRKLRKMGISAAALNSDALKRFQNSSVEQARGRRRRPDPIQQIERNETQVVFASPEVFLGNARAAKAVCEGRWANALGAVIVDEAHVVFDWGMPSKHGKPAFRPEFGKLALLLAKFRSNVPWIALTATLVGPAVPAVCTALCFGRLPFFALDVGKERDRCIYNIQAFQHPSTSFLDLVEILPANPTTVDQLPKTIVYVNSRVLATEGAAILRQRLPPALSGAVASFSAADTKRKRKRIMREFRSGKIWIVVATEALGMGIDLPDIDMVIQWQLPNDFKALVQHFGRGARGPQSQARALLLCDSLVYQATMAMRARPCETTTIEEVKVTIAAKQKWKGLDRQTRDWLGSRDCLKAALARLLKLDFSQLPSGNGASPPHVRTHDTGLGPLSSLDNQPSFFWRRERSTTSASNKPSSSSSACCSKCDPQHSVVRHPMPVTDDRTQQRLVAPPASHETVEVRQALGKTLLEWRLRMYTEQRGTKRWHTEETIMTADVIIGLVARAPRILAYVKHGNTIDLDYVRLLLGDRSGVRADHMADLEAVIVNWAMASSIPPSSPS
ncbi:unnamed protein product [Tilletia controversa]|nr:unnamed protein product [Tilletia controversa]